MLLPALALVLVVALSFGATAGAKKGKGKGRTKVTLCHKAKVTIRVGAPAVKAHLKHGDALGPCPRQAPAPGTALLTVFKNAVNDSGGTKTAADFAITINGVTAVGGNSFAGSAQGVTRTITTFGAYNVTETTVSGYALTHAFGCAGTIAAGQHKICVLTNDDIPATLTLVKHVINENGGKKSAGDFTLTINGVTADGGNSVAGSETGVTKTLSSVGAYNVSEGAVVGYALKSASSDCSGTIALGEHKTCLLTNDDV